MTGSEPTPGRPDGKVAPNGSAAGPAFAVVPRSIYPTLVALFVGVMLISNITATKGVQIGPIVTDGAFYLFPLAYILGDVISEVYGFRAMRRAVFIGFAALVLASFAFWATIELPAADFYENQESFRAVVGVVPLFLLASLAGYLTGELLNSWVLVRMKARTGERRLWARLMGSTIVGEFADTVAFCSIAAVPLGISTFGDFVNFTIAGFFWKTAVELLMLPATYRIIAWVKRREPTYGTVSAP